MSKDTAYKYIYKLVNTVNGKAYVGQSGNPSFRYFEHLTGLGSKLVYRAVQKYGIEKFLGFVIDTADSREEANQKEQFWIKELKAFGDGYNLSPGGDGFGCGEDHPYYKSGPPQHVLEASRKAWTGCNHTEETKKTMSDQKMGQLNPMYGVKHSPERVQQIRELNKTFRHTEEHKQSIKGEGNYFYGRTHSEETRRLISQARKGKPPWNKGLKMNKEGLKSV